jgi:hypothetical protein
MASDDPTAARHACLHLLDRLEAVRIIKRPLTTTWEWTDYGRGLVKAGQLSQLLLTGDVGTPEAALLAVLRIARAGEDYLVCRNMESGQTWLTCRRCGATSFHPTDVAERYCGRCHEFLDEGGQPR